MSDLLRERYSAFGLFNLALTGAPEVVAADKETFTNPKIPPAEEQETKNIAAWVALRSGEDEPYFSHLMQQAERAFRNEIPGGNGVDINRFREAFSYLASIRSQRVKDFLERALDSSSQGIMQIAAVILLFY